MIKSVLRFILILVMLACMLVLVPSGTVMASAEVVEIPLAAEMGLEPWEEGFGEGYVYEDPSISVRIETGSMFGSKYFAAYIKIANPSQIRSYICDGFRSSVTKPGYILARRANAVLAIDGDFCERKLNENSPAVGLVVRQGVEYRKNIRPLLDDKYPDILIIDENGDFTILPNAQPEDVNGFAGTIVNSYSFGPGLVINGERVTAYRNMNDGAFKPTQRMAVAQIGPLEYMCICCEGPEDPGSVGMTMDEFSQLVASFDGVMNAYNLDGGSSAQMVFHYEKINAVEKESNKNRPLRDILYFASAYQPE